MLYAPVIFVSAFSSASSCTVEGWCAISCIIVSVSQVVWNIAPRFAR